MAVWLCVGFSMERFSVGISQFHLILIGIPFPFNIIFDFPFLEYLYHCQELFLSGEFLKVQNLLPRIYIVTELLVLQRSEKYFKQGPKEKYFFFFTFKEIIKNKRKS